MRTAARKQNQTYAIIDNKVGSKYLVGQLNELHSDDDEEQKLEQTSNEWEESKTAAKWIQMKEDTDKLSLDQVKQIVVERIWGESHHKALEERVQKELDSLNICCSDNEWESGGWQQVSEGAAQTLMNRPKGAYLTYNERLWIYKSFRYEGCSLSKICQRYGVSISTAKRIIKQFSSNIRRSEIYSKIRCKKAIFSSTVMDWISEYVKSISWRFTSLHVRRHILKNLSIPIPRHQICKHLKHNERLSYKKGSARPYTLDIKKLKLTKQLFWVKLAQSLPSIKILINLDESTVSKDTKANYSWLKTSKHWSINNIVFGGSINLISCITTDRLAINLLKHWSSNAKTLIKFLKYLFEYLKEQGIFPYQTGIIIDNWAFHRAIWVKDYWRSIGVNLYYLPAYWP